MTDLETRLEHALKADDPAPRDPMFRIEILVRRERDAFRRKLLTTGAMALGTAILVSLGIGAMDAMAGPGAARLAALAAAAGVVLTAARAAPHAGFWALRSVVGRWRDGALSTLRTMPSLRLWS